MTAVNFPDNPTLNQTFSVGDRTWKWTGVSWDAEVTLQVVGPTGATGRGITSINRTSGNGSAGTIDTFTITYSDNTTSTFDVYNGSNGSNGRGITSISRTSGNGDPGTTDTYTIYYSDSTTSTFTVYNGATGPKGDKGDTGATGATPVISKIHTQNAPSSVWVITNDLGFYPNVVTTDTAGTIVEGEVSYTSPSIITVTFSQSIGGYAYLS